MIWIIGGTAETGEAVQRIRNKVKYLVTVATSGGREMLDDERVMTARMDETAMRNFLHTHRIELVVDLSHPYAVDVSRNARRACQDAGVRYMRYVRESSKIENASYVASLSECLKFLQSVTGCVFFTTGSKNIPDFEQVRGSNRFVYRVLPMPESLEMCVRHQVPMRDIVAMLGPLSEELNAAMFREYQANYVVMKDSGKAGGTPQKIAACRQLDITPVILDRPCEEDDSISDLDAIINMLLCSFQGNSALPQIHER